MQTHALDEVWWIPTYQHAFAKDLAPYADRRAMCELATAPLGRVRIVDIERELGGESRTIDTVKALEARHPRTRFSLIVGADILGETDRWKSWDELMSLVDLVVVGRKGFDTPGQIRELSLPDISSTEIRRFLEHGDHRSLASWVPRLVLDYIDVHRLYIA